MSTQGAPPSTAAPTRELVEMISEFAQREVAPGAAQRDELDDHVAGFPFELWRQMGQLNLHSLALPESIGGIGADYRTMCELAAAFGRHGRDFGLGLSWISSMFTTAVPINRLGTEEQKAQYLPGLMSGELIGAQANTEPHAGSDLKTIRTRAVRDGDDWVINGSKIFITNAPIAGVIMVLAVTDPTAGRSGMSFFLVERDTPGMTIGPPMKKMGTATSPTSEVFFDDCVVPGNAILGDSQHGFFDFLLSIHREVLVLTALTLGALEACMDQSIRYAKEREQFGLPIAEFQAISHKLADMRIAGDTGRAMINRVATLIDDEAEARAEASVAKVFVSEAALQTALDAVQIHGGYGYMREYEVERMARDIKLMTIGGGTNEIHRNMIAKQLLT